MELFPSNYNPVFLKKKKKSRLLSEDKVPKYRLDMFSLKRKKKKHENKCFVTRSFYIKKVLRKTQTSNWRLNGSVLVPTYSLSPILSFPIINISCCNCFKKPGAGEMAQSFRALAEGLGLVSASI